LENFFLRTIQIDSPFYFRKEAALIRKLKNYKPTKFMAKDSVYDEDDADYAVSFIQALTHTKVDGQGNSLN
jgi:hypothetical protein